MYYRLWASTRIIWLRSHCDKRSARTLCHSSSSSLLWTPQLINTITSLGAPFVCRRFRSWSPRSKQLVVPDWQRFNMSHGCRYTFRITEFIPQVSHCYFQFVTPCVSTALDALYLRVCPPGPAGIVRRWMDLIGLHASMTTCYVSLFSCVSCLLLSGAGLCEGGCTEIYVNFWSGINEYVFVKMGDATDVQNQHVAHIVQICP